MSQRPSIPVRHRTFVRERFIPTYRRAVEDNVLDARERQELDNLVDGILRFVDASAANQLLDAAINKATDEQYINDLVVVRNVAVAMLPDCA